MFIKLMIMFSSFLSLSFPPFHYYCVSCFLSLSTFLFLSLEREWESVLITFFQLLPFFLGKIIIIININIQFIFHLTFYRGRKPKCIHKQKIKS